MALHHIVFTHPVLVSECYAPFSPLTLFAKRNGARKPSGPWYKSPTSRWSIDLRLKHDLQLFGAVACVRLSCMPAIPENELTLSGFKQRAAKDNTCQFLWVLGNIYFISTSFVSLPKGFFPLLLPFSCFGSGSGRLSRVAEVRVAHCLSFGFYYWNQCCSHHGASFYLLLITHSPPPRVPICSAGVGTLEGGVKENCWPSWSTHPCCRVHCGNSSNIFFFLTHVSSL